MSKARPVFSSTAAMPKSPPGPRSNRNSTLRSRPLKSPAFAPLWRKKNMTLLRTVLLTSMGALALAACGESKTDPAKEQEVVEIGRASCRERVCQYRVALGGRRLIKKKNTKNEKSK